MIVFEKFAKGIIIPATLVLTSCGGGGDIAGARTDFSVAPDSLEIQAVKGDEYCQGTRGAELVVTVTGGVAPYRVVNSSPQNFTVSDTILTGKNPTFKVTTFEGCTTDLQIVVYDYQSRAASVKITIKPGDKADVTGV